MSRDASGRFAPATPKEPIRRSNGFTLADIVSLAGPDFKNARVVFEEDYKISKVHGVRLVHNGDGSIIILLTKTYLNP